MLETALRIVPDFPKAGVDFIDIAPILEDPPLFTAAIGKLESACAEWNFDKIVAIESRGFVFGAPLACRMQKGLVMVRKPGKLPGQTLTHSYDLEYGSDTLEILQTSLKGGDRVVILDDVLATGGSAGAAQTLVQQTGATVVGFAFFIELAFLKGRGRLGDTPVGSVIVKD